MINATLALGLLSILVHADPRTPLPIVIVDEPSEVRRALKAHRIKFDELSPTTLAEAETARHALAPYLKAEIARERDKDRKEKLGQILSHIDAYAWSCGGFKRRGEKSLFCVFERLEGLGQGGKGFREMADGGTWICRLVFHLRDRRIDKLEWNDDG
jgi:hypothetical protein